MSETPTATVKDIPQESLPLSVLLFQEAMNRDMALSEFADQLGINALSLRQFIAGKTQRPRSRTLEVLADALAMSVEEVRERASLRPMAAPPFADWLKSFIDSGFSRAKLTRETRISDGALRNYLSGQTLPDSDQAKRLADVLDADPLELAMVLVADQTVRAGGETIEPPDDDLDPVDVDEAIDETAYATPAGDGFFDENGHRGGIAARVAVGALTGEEEHLVFLWRQLHPQGRRATLTYIASLLVEG